MVVVSPPKNQNITYDIANNKYVIKDPTLPRLNNIKCINPKCLNYTNYSLSTGNN